MMMAFTPNLQPQWAQTISLTVLQDTCNLMRITDTPDGYGGETRTASVVTSNIKCAYSASVGNEVLTGGQVVGLGDYIINMPLGIDVQMRDQIVINARGGTSAKTYEVKANLSSTDGLYTRVLATLSQ